MLPRNPTRKEKGSCLSPGPAATLPAPLLRSRWIVDRGDFWTTVREFLSREEGSPGILEEGRRGHSRSIIPKMENKTGAGNTTGTAALTTTLPSTHHRHIPPRSAQHMQRHDTTFSPKVTPMGGCLPYPDHPVPFWRLRPPSFFPTPPSTPPSPPVPSAITSSRPPLPVPAYSSAFLRLLFATAAFPALVPANHLTCTLLTWDIDAGPPRTDARGEISKKKKRRNIRIRLTLRCETGIEPWLGRYVVYACIDIGRRGHIRRPDPVFLTD